MNFLLGVLGVKSVRTPGQDTCLCCAFARGFRVCFALCGRNLLDLIANRIDNTLCLYLINRIFVFLGVIGSQSRQIAPKSVFMIAHLRAARKPVLLNFLFIKNNLSSVHMYILAKVSSKLVENCTFSGYLSTYGGDFGSQI